MHGEDGAAWYTERIELFPAHARICVYMSREGALLSNLLSLTNPRGWYCRGYLPHFDAGPSPQLVTFRLTDSFPASVLQDWMAELAGMDPPHAECERRRRIEEYLDLGHGSAWLSRPEVAEIIEQALIHFDAHRYCLHAWCVMPNHVHALLTVNASQDLSRIVHSWKSFTANKANAYLARSGAFWQREYFDRFIRDEQHLQAALDYIENNPVKAGLSRSPGEWRYSSAFRA